MSIQPKTVGTELPKHSMYQYVECNLQEYGIWVKGAGSVLPPVQVLRNRFFVLSWSYADFKHDNIFIHKTYDCFVVYIYDTVQAGNF